MRRNVISPFALLTVISGCVAGVPSVNWTEAFGYGESEVHSLEVGEFGYPFVPVTIGGVRVSVPFDTGNMVGLSVSSETFEQLGLVAAGTYDRVSSAGETIATLRIAEPAHVTYLGRDLGAMKVFELEHPSLPGLAGPVLLQGGHFTIDYQSRRIGVGRGPLPDSVPGFRPIPMIRSARHPYLVLVKGTIEGREVVIELDTGKSRTVIHPDLASSLELERGSRGRAIESLRIGDLSFEVPNAKEVDQTAIDPNLREPILAGVGSDVLSSFVWTVDYEAGMVWVEDRGER